MSLPLIVFTTLRDRPHPDTGGAEQILHGATLFFTGNTVIAYWYVPAILVIFLMSPLHMAFQRLSLSHQLSLTAMLYLLSTLRSARSRICSFHSPCCILRLSISPG